LLAPLLLVAARAEDLVLADFEGSDYGRWEVTGKAFGTQPARGALAGQMPVGGFRGQGLVNSFAGGDGSTGTLTSPPFRVSHPFLNFLVGGGAHEGRTCIQVLVGGQPVRTVTGRDDETLSMATFELREFLGKEAQLRLIDDATGGWGHINADHFVLSDTAATPPVRPVVVDISRLYDETWRPQFHFTAPKNWLNDPNGLVYLDGEYHLFYQHNPEGREWGNMTWAHAVSPDLFHWQNLDHALWPDRWGTMFSGSAVVDRRNTGGFQRGPRPPLVAFYTAAGGTSPESKGMPFTQCLAYSHDRGRTWTKYEHNPVVPNVGDGDRDPKVIWHEPTRKWVMPLYVGEKETGPDGKPRTRHRLHIYVSPDLKSWSFTSKFAEDLFECPGLLPLKGVSGPANWVLFGASGEYWVGTFDGREFRATTPKLKGDHGGNFYAAQAYDDLPDGRNILVGWMNGGKYPGMPFNQQMGLPMTLELRPTPEGPRLRRWPVAELDRLQQGKPVLRLKQASGTQVAASLAQLPLELNDLRLELPLTPWRLTVRGLPLEWKPSPDRGPGQLTVKGRTARFTPGGNTLRLRLILDRTSLETFADDGLVVFSDCFLPPPEDRNLRLELGPGSPAVPSIEIHALKSAWRP
jgi:fructan beta-fructosidase